MGQSGNKASLNEIKTDFDVVIAGGGVNGAGIARDLAGRGFHVLLCERDDLASHTSSSSTKLIHGGLRYLEHFEFSLVRKALIEREILMKSSPHIIWPMRFVMPYDPSMRPAWMIRLGIFLYDHLAKREILPGSNSVNFANHESGAPLQSHFKLGFEYSDAWVDDARLVVLNAIAAKQKGATILTRTACTSAVRQNQTWEVSIQNDDGESKKIRARLFVNATGPWAESFLKTTHISSNALKEKNLRLIKGSHIVIPRIFDHNFSYIFQNADKRITFAIPYENTYTLIGTTDVEFQGDPKEVHASSEEIAYLCQQVNHYFKKTITPADVVRHYSGVRPLLEDQAADASATTRDYELQLTKDHEAPLLTVWGGKITTYRVLAEEASNLISSTLQPSAKPWTASSYLPGGDLRSYLENPNRPDLDFSIFLDKVQQAYPWIPKQLMLRWARAYGSRIPLLIKTATCLSDLGQEIAPLLFEAELHYLINEEWAKSAEDILWRRTKLGLHFSQKEIQQVNDWMNHQVKSPEGLACN